MVDFVYKDYYDVKDFIHLIALLRGPGGCPWDAEQTHDSIRRNLLEEAYEVCEAIDEDDPMHLREELGDLMMQVIFHSRMEEERGGFSIDDVADTACKKLIQRHPHVFGNVEVGGSGDVLTNWDEIKRRERSQSTTASVMDGVAKSLPSLWRAEKIQKKAKKVGFDWPEVSGAVDKLSEEFGELAAALSDGGREAVKEELGDLLFAAVNVSRFAGIDPEEALHESCDKFICRFRGMEDLAASRGLGLSSLSLDEQEAMYQESKHMK